MRRSSVQWMNQIVTALGFVLLYLPIAIVAIYSVVSLSPNNRDSALNLDFSSWTLLASNQRLTSALFTSITVAVMAATIATVIGTLAAIGLERGRPYLKNVTEALCFAPFVLPELVFGLALLLWFVFLRMALGWFSLVLAHVTFSVSYVVMTVRGRMATLDPQLNDAAQDLGASPMQAFFAVTLPLLYPAIGAGWLMGFAMSFDDFLISFFTAGVETTTLPLALYSYVKFGIDRQIFALSTLLFAVTLAGVILATRVRTKTLKPQ